MLVLSRKVGQQIVIGQDVWIKLLDVRGNCVRLGITAPETVVIHREEVRQRMNHSLEAPKASENVAKPRSSNIDAA